MGDQDSQDLLDLLENGDLRGVLEPEVSKDCLGQVERTVNQERMVRLECKGLLE